MPGPNLFGLEFAAMLWGPSQQSAWDQLVVPGYTETQTGRDGLLLGDMRHTTIERTNTQHAQQLE